MIAAEIFWSLGFHEKILLVFLPSIIVVNTMIFVNFTYCIAEKLLIPNAHS